MFIISHIIALKARTFIKRMFFERFCSSSFAPNFIIFNGAKAFCRDLSLSFLRWKFLNTPRVNNNASNISALGSFLKVSFLQPVLSSFGDAVRRQKNSWGFSSCLSLAALPPVNETVGTMFVPADFSEK